MINYIIRVAFDDPESQTHHLLAVELAKYNIANAIKADDGKGYYLPPGEFCYSGVEPINEVRDAIHRFAQTINPGASVLVTEATTVSWAGLKEVT
nr:hypothetical protein [uncultured Duganella sp.]